MRVCTKCKLEKPLDGFWVHRDGYRPACKECMADAQRARQARDPALAAARRRRSNLKMKFGVTPEWYNQLLAVQGGGCAICGTATPGGKGAFHVDHCHTTGTVRRLLCSACNTGLGFFRDNPDFLFSAANYLLEFQS